MTIIEMPKLSDTMTEGTLVKWLKKEGDTIEIGDVIAEVETDKATMEMEAFDEGTLGKIYVTEGGKALVNAAIAVLVEEGEEAPANPPREPAVRRRVEEKTRPRSQKRLRPSPPQPRRRSRCRPEKAEGSRPVRLPGKSPLKKGCP